MASPDALIRLGSTPLVDEQTEICQIYMEKQHHASLEAFIQSEICSAECTKGMLMQVKLHVYTYTFQTKV